MATQHPTDWQGNVRGIGIDIEHCENLPAATDPWTQPFYVENFTKAEIAYCQRQPNPRESFCGLWCAKEAVRKCGAEFFSVRPLDLEIGHDADGRPFLSVLCNGKQEARRDCAISISHSHGLCVAACVSGAGGEGAGRQEGLVDLAPRRSGANVLAWVAIGLGVLNLLLWLLR